MRILLASTLLLPALLACSKKSGNPTDPGGATPYSWSLNLNLDGAYDSLLQGTVINAEAKGSMSGKVRHYDPALLSDSLYFKIAGIPNFRFGAALNSSGDFSFKASDLLGTLYGPLGLKIFPTSKDSKYRPSPDTLRITVNRSLAYPWTLDMTLPGGTAFQALAGDTVVTAKDTSSSGDISGKVNQYSSIALVDTIYFFALTYPENTLQAPLDSQGNFRFDIFDIVGSMDGEHKFDIAVKPKSGEFKPVPDSIRFWLTRQ